MSTRDFYAPTEKFWTDFQSFARRELTLDEILFDDEEVFQRKRQEQRENQDLTSDHDWYRQYKQCDWKCDWTLVDSNTTSTYWDFDASNTYWDATDYYVWNK